MDEHQYIFGTSASELKETKEVKMRIPIAHLIRLHGLKLLSGQNISETVTKALEYYFERIDGHEKDVDPEEAAEAADEAEQQVSTQ